jgi:hypothetical protein
MMRAPQPLQVLRFLHWTSTMVRTAKCGATINLRCKKPELRIGLIRSPGRRSLQLMSAASVDQRRGPTIEDQFEFGWLLDGQVSRFGATERCRLLDG